MKVMTFNVRVDVESDGIYSFKHRIEGIVKFLEEEKPDIIGFQEVRPGMLDVLVKRLVDYNFVGEPRSENDEYNPIFYKKNHQLLYTATRWFGDTPTIKGSKQKDAYFPRIYCFAHLEIDGVVYEIINTHFSHISHTARLESLNTLVQYYQKRTNNYKFILMGDFNAYPSENVDEILSKYLNSCWKDYTGDTLTFHGFTTRIEGYPIDYIWFDKELIASKPTIHRKLYNDLFLSDHFPISLIIK
ncbi:MAG: endonuclease/exonuclease/phosphatase family protein [Candidatus Izemoplasmatales bacterium]